jgi:acyl-CoA-binding protein
MKSPDYDRINLTVIVVEIVYGEVRGKKPGMMDLVGKAKYGAWGKVKGTSSEKGTTLGRSVCCYRFQV